MTDWADLAAELDRWAEAGRRASLWWRDDDAVTATPRLADLRRIAGDVPLALAVIPALARPELAAALAEWPQVAVLQHGWQHLNRAGGGAKKSEYPSGRGVAAVTAEIAAGRARLAALFGRRALPVFVPPWNRMGDEFLAILPPQGIAAVSAVAHAVPSAPPAGLARLDVDLDLVDWRGDRGFIGEAAALHGLLVCLQQRRRRRSGSEEAVGLLTHHLIIDRATAAFVARLADVIRSHRAGHWAAVANLL